MAVGILVKSLEARLQSVQAPIGRLNINDAFCAVAAVFSTASVNMTAGNADACTHLQLVHSRFSQPGHTLEQRELGELEHTAP